MRIEETILLLLAAGRSDRFGGASKLDRDLHGRPLGMHVVDALAPLAFAGRIAVTGRTLLDYGVAGYETVVNPAPEAGMSGSIRLGVTRAVGRAPGAILIVLADMPCVTAVHVERLFAEQGADVVASYDGDAAKPPALFAASRFDDLLALGGSGGAHALIASARRVRADRALLADVDVPADLDRLRETMAG